jgi:hypothetical protein
MNATNDWGAKARELLGERGIAVDENATQRAALAADLIEAAMLACDHHGDGEQAREAMRSDCLATPDHLRPDLIDYFRCTYSRPGTVFGSGLGGAA